VTDFMPNPLTQKEMKHFGIRRRSGRYPWGSGKDEYQRSLDFASYVKGMKDQGLDEKTIAKAIGMEVQAATGDPKAGFTVADLRSTTTISKEAIVQEQTQRAVTLKAKGVSVKAIAEELDIPQPTVRLRLKNSENLKKSTLTNTADVIRKAVDEHQIVDVGKGVDVRMQISSEKLKAATAILRDEGYETHNLRVPNVGTRNLTNQLVIVPPGTGFGNARRMVDKIHTMGDYTYDEGKTFFGIHYPKSIASSRLKVVFKEDGGTAMDGTIFVRTDKPDLDMGKNKYAQVRIAIDGTHYIKGIAIPKNDLPAGVDLLFHSNKSRSVGKMGALKEMADPKTGKIDQDNPFGAIIKRQIVEHGKDGIERVKSALNLVNEEGDWDTWHNSMPSQLLAKQPHSLIKSQLDTTRVQIRERLAELDRITNPVVRRDAYEKFADALDSDAVDLRAAAMPRQRTQVIIPMPHLKKGEIYAPNFETGERVVLIRYPHGGRFEIPEVVVNNKSRKAAQLIGNAADAIGIHPAVAQRLSGADFDGDTVVVIPNRGGKVKGSIALGSKGKIYDEALAKFEPKHLFGGYEEKDGKGNFPLMTNTGLEMGKITNLVTDMSIQGAKPEHIIRAVKHSMVVIDAEKHKLNYKASEEQHGIKQLKELYQAHINPDTGRKSTGASTLLSQATAKDRIPERKLRPAKEGGPIDPDTGAKVYVPTKRTTSKFDKKTGTYLDEKVPVHEKVKRLELVDDAYKLVRDKSDPVERLYADHANEMKALANTTRLRAARTQSPKVNKKATLVYKDEVSKLVADLKKAESQKPLDRKADIIAGAAVKAKHKEDPLLRYDQDRKKKVERQAKSAARARLGLEKPIIPISDRQWDAIQSGAVSSSRLKAILKYADPDVVMKHALPKGNPVMSAAITARAKAMLGAGATNADVAAALGIPLGTLKSAALRGDV